MAQQGVVVQATGNFAPAVRVGVPNDGIKERFESLARRAFEIFENNGRSLGHDLANWYEAERELFHSAHIDVAESDQDFTVRVEVPGFAAKELSINIEGHRLTISGKREKHEERKDKKTIYSETCSGQLLRVVDLPMDVNAEGAKANLKDGILELEIPKAAPAKRIAIESKTA